MGVFVGHRVNTVLATACVLRSPNIFHDISGRVVDENEGSEANMGYFPASTAIHTGHQAPTVQWWGRSRAASCSGRDGPRTLQGIKVNMITINR